MEGRAIAPGKRNRELVLLTFLLANLLIFSVTVAIAIQGPFYAPRKGVVIEESQTWKDRVIRLEDNLSIGPAGNLTLDNTTVFLTCAYDGKNGVYVDGTLAVLNGSRITVEDGNCHFDFRVFGKIKIKDSFVSKLNSGIDIMGMGAVENSTIRSSKGLGIKEQGNGNSIVDSILENCSSGGINALGKDTLMSGNFIHGGIIGINSNGEGQVVANNTIIDNERYGIIANGDSLIQGNTVTNSGWWGIYSVHKSPHIMDNVISDVTNIDNFYHGGIRTDGGIPIIKNNRLSGNSDGIIAYYGSRPVLDGNILTNNMGTALVFNESVASVSNTTISGSGHADISLSSGAEASLVNVSFNPDRVNMDACPECNLTVGWNVRIKVVNSSIDGEVFQASVSVRNSNNEGIYAGFTNLDGITDEFVVTEYERRGAEITSFSPFHIEASKNGKSSSQTLPIDRSQVVVQQIPEA